MGFADSEIAMKLLEPIAAHQIQFLTVLFSDRFSDLENACMNHHSNDRGSNTPTGTPPSTPPAPPLLKIVLLYAVIWAILLYFFTATHTPLTVYGIPDFSPGGAVLWAQGLDALVLGFLWGVGGILGWFGCQVAWGWLAAGGVRSWQIPSLATLLLSLPLAFWISSTEEFLFRGVLVTQLVMLLTMQISMQVAIAMPFSFSFSPDFLPNFWHDLLPTLPLITSIAVINAIFALSHRLWLPHLPTRQLWGLWFLGGVLSWARLQQAGDLSLAIGLHTGWIWALAMLGAIAPTAELSPTAPHCWASSLTYPLNGGLSWVMLGITAIAIAYRT